MRTTTETGSSRRPPGRPGAFAVVAASVAGFLIVFTLLAWQLGRGQDPALGAAEKSAASSPANRRVVVTRVVHDPPTSVAASPGTYSSDATGSAPAVGAAAPASTPAPAASAPAPAPAATAPAPAPAPVATGSS